MSETKRRSKRAEINVDNDTNGSDAPLRKSRVTLTKDVSSRYRKIMPVAGNKDSGRRRGKPSDERSGESSNKYVKGGGARKNKEFSGGLSEAKRNARFPRSAEGGAGFERKFRFSSDNDSSSALGEAKRNARSARPGGSGFERKFRPSSGAGPARNPRSRFERPRNFDKNTGSDGFRNSIELKAIVHRELPEASKQIKETQDLLLSVSGELLNIIEKLEQLHTYGDGLLKEALAVNNQLHDSIEPILSSNQEVSNAITCLYEKMSFHDLSGQRLTKVESFLKALENVISKYSAKKNISKDFQERSFSKARSEVKKTRLKGPQSVDDALRQGDVDKLLEKS